MIPQAPRADLFKEPLREALPGETLNSHSVTIARHANVYTCGNHDDMVYFIESGQIKLLLLLPEGKGAGSPPILREMLRKITAATSLCGDTKL